MLQKHKVGIIGLGYVGLTTAVCFASRGYDVIGYDVDREKIDLLRLAKPTFYEKGLTALLKKVIRNKKFVPTCDEYDLNGSKIIFLCVGTPSSSDGSANLDYIKSSAEVAARLIRSKKDYKVICVKSTVPPTTTSQVVLPILERESGKMEGASFGLCANPEFLREGNAIEDTLHPDRIVIGSNSKKTANILRRFYAEFYGKKDLPFLVTDPTNAELIKYANNAFLATKISFINSIARICQRIPGGDVEVIAKGIGMDRRIGSQFLRAGLGYGGSCFPKDVKAIIALSKNRDVDTSLLDSVYSINDEQPLEAVRIAKKALGGLVGKTVAILGLAFKPETNDLREAVSIKIVNELLSNGSKVHVHDPMAMQNARAIFGDKIRYCETKEDCLRGSDCAIIVTEWKEYYTLKPQSVIKLMHYPIVVDGRRVLDPKLFAKTKYFAIGLGR